ncbi:glycosyltransferase family 4 protein [Ectopseudomonas oleovorans]|uniref:glycosyltransferase family 4 protein n=1 Tax=Ectopseudomonas oleovorans TaxID=301 RepID=UPI0019D12CD5|nr:glycosyltransferase family 4 protein [Pseudomonas oleovorans]MBN7118794.1 glycosyl transferase family 1 [Pseudomonas oleovorans]MBN7132300.1 glycosyl transferase family 1 [Pseudomonas oleovorans]MBN7142259.1 glycosyl transferase family 1 [Pseudomonas oleovorans]
MPKRILLLTFFYPPDLSAGSFRAQALVDALRRRAGADMQIDVLTTQPNRYASHASEVDSVEEAPGLYVRRVHLPQMREGFVGQAVSFWRYARRVRGLTAAQDYDLVLATSSRLMTAVLGGWIAYRRGARLYLDIRDIFVENLKMLFPTLLAKPLGWTFGALERWAIGRAQRVNLVSQGFLGYFQPRYPALRFPVFSNGVDEAFATFAAEMESALPCPAAEPLQVLYAGNLGDGQGMHLILPELARRLRGRAYFRVVGAGGRLEPLRDSLRSMDLDNVELLPPVAREQLLEFYREADVLFLHLNDYSAFKRVLPSKLFEYAATGKPIWAGVAGYAAEFIASEVSNASVFAPCDLEAALESFEQLRIGVADRTAFVQRYARERIMNEMAQDILQLLEPA